MSRRTVPEGIRITKVGLWFIVLTVLVAIPAANTGNNSLYLVEACLLALLVVSGVTSRQNLRRLDIGLTPPTEVYANQPFGLGYRIRHSGRMWDRRLLVIAGIGEGKPILISHLARGEDLGGHLELMAKKRGLLAIPYIHLSSIYPLGLFRKGMRYRSDVELLVYPQLLEASAAKYRGAGPVGEHPSQRPGGGHELHTLRKFRFGDDRRGIHWKQTARTGELIFMEREAERGQRVSLLFDNAVSGSDDPEAAEAFEIAVSEVATAAHHLNERGFEIELITRGEIVGFGRGPRQRQRMLRSLALISAVSNGGQPLVGSDPSAPTIFFDVRGGD
jgi:uncharacterized protein (DUF58 family)